MSCRRATAPFLAGSQARSDDAEADSFEQPLVAPAIHPFTGTFAASEHTVAFGSKAFRFMFPLHIFALALLLFLACVSATLGTEYYFFLLLALGVLVARIAMHRWSCPARAQRFGAIAWTITVACGCAWDFIDCALDTKAVCEAAGDLYYPMIAILFTLINASHSMEFWHTASLAGLLLCDLIAVRAVCVDSAPISLAIVALVVTFGAGHIAQLLARHAFLRVEHIQTSRDRLEHDFQRLEHRIFGSIGPQLPPAVTPTESSVSAPEATGGGHTALPAGQVLIEWPPPHANHPSTAGPSTAGPSTAGPSTAADPLSAAVPLSAAALPPPLPPLSASVPLTTLEYQALLSRPMFTMSAEEIARLRELQAQMERERQEDEASDVLSRHGDAPSQPSGSWSSSDPSSATCNLRRRRNREIYELRRGISAPANLAAARRCPYI